MSTAPLTSVTVQTGNTLWSIARGQGLTDNSKIAVFVDKIAKMNNLFDRNLLPIGQVLYVPKVTSIFPNFASAPVKPATQTEVKAVPVQQEVTPPVTTPITPAVTPVNETPAEPPAQELAPAAPETTNPPQADLPDKNLYKDYKDWEQSEASATSPFTFTSPEYDNAVIDAYNITQRSDFKSDSAEYKTANDKIYTLYKKDLTNFAEQTVSSSKLDNDDTTMIYPEYVQSGIDAYNNANPDNKVEGKNSELIMKIAEDSKNCDDKTDYPKFVQEEIDTFKKDNPDAKIGPNRIKKLLSNFKLTFDATDRDHNKKVDVPEQGSVYAYKDMQKDALAPRASKYYTDGRIWLNGNSDVDEHLASVDPHTRKSIGENLDLARKYYFGSQE